MQPTSAELFENDLPLVLVDDEISTGAPRSMPSGRCTGNAREAATSWPRWWT